MAETFSVSDFSFKVIIATQSLCKVYYEKLRGRHCAVKATTDPLASREVDMMATTLAGVKGLPTLYGAFTSDGTTYMVMTFFPGCTIDRLFIEFRRGLSLAFATDVVTQLLAILSEIHARGAVHRDVKASNVVVNHTGRVGLLDMGLASPCTPRCTTPCGTQHIRCPEMVQGRSYDTKCDVWAVGVLFYEMVTGRPPFGLRGDDIGTKVLQGLDKGHFEGTSLWTPAAVEFVMAALEPDPALRPTVEALRCHALVALSTAVVSLDGDGSGQCLPSATPYGEEIEMQCLGMYFSDALAW